MAQEGVCTLATIWITLVKELYIIPYNLMVFSRSWLAFGYNVIFYMFHKKMFISGYRQFVLNTAECSCHFRYLPYLIQQDKQKFLVSFF